MKLFYKSGACSLSPHIILLEANLPFTLEKVDLATKKTEHGDDFLKINPKGQVPTLLLDDGSILTEGVAIVQFLADKVPGRNLIPANGTLARYHAIEWLNYIATELHKGFSPLFNPKTPDEFKEITKQKLFSQFKYLDGVLSKQQYVLGDHFSVADAYLFTILGWAKPMHFDLTPYSSLTAYIARVTERPTVQEALKVEHGK